MATHPSSCLENPMDRGAWWATVFGVAKSRTWLSTHTSTSLFASSPVSSSVLLCSAKALQNLQAGSLETEPEWDSHVGGWLEVRIWRIWEGVREAGQTQGTMPIGEACLAPVGALEWEPHCRRRYTEKGPGFHTPAPVSDGLLVLQARLLEETALGCWLASGEGRWEMGTPALKWGSGRTPTASATERFHPHISPSSFSPTKHHIN